jgi:DNA primase
MPGVDFNAVRAEITMEQVLTLLGFQPLHQSGAQWYGVCPLHGSRSRRSRSFSVNVATQRDYCHSCHSYGNHLDLWAAAIDLCRRSGRDVPWICRR